MNKENIIKLTSILIYLLIFSLLFISVNTWLLTVCVTLILATICNFIVKEEFIVNYYLSDEVLENGKLDNFYKNVDSRITLIKEESVKSPMLISCLIPFLNMFRTIKVKNVEKYHFDLYSPIGYDDNILVYINPNVTYETIKLKMVEDNLDLSSIDLDNEDINEQLFVNYLTTLKKTDLNEMNEDGLTNFLRDLIPQYEIDINNKINHI